MQDLVQYYSAPITDAISIHTFVNLTFSFVTHLFRMNIRILLFAFAVLLCTKATYAQVPANDDPCAAIPLTVGATCTYATYTNANATATAGVPAPGCASYSGGDVWFTFTVPASGAVTIDGIQGVITDGGMAVYSATACNGTFTLIQCDDDNSTNGLMPFLNIAGQTPGATLYIRFWEYGNNNNGTFGICVTGFTPPTPPANDNPCSAIAVTVNNSCNYTQYTNANATTTAGIPAPGCANYAGGDVWFSFVVPASGNVSLDASTGVITDGGMAVYSATACNGTFTLIQCDDDNSANGLMPALNLTGLAPGATMYVRFWEYGGDNNGTFGLCVFDNSLPPPPPNNTCLAPIPDICFSACNLGALPTPAPCSGAVAISPGAIASFGMSNVGAIAENPYSAVVGCATPATDVWYRFQATGTQLVMSITSLANALNNSNISLYNGNNCNALLPLGCFTGAGGTLSATFSPITPGDFYYLQISGGNTADVGDFILNIRNNLDCATCLLAQDLQVTPAPVNGTYAAGQTVNFCFTVSNYNQTAANWLHGIDLNFGAGWNIATLTPTTIPPSCATTVGASWGFYNSVTSIRPGSPTYGPGFWYESSSGNATSVTDGNPGNNFGDQGVSITCPRTFCWQITTQPPGACTPGASLQVGINTLGDSESGSWTSNGCTTDPIVNFLATLACCAQPTISTTNASCGLSDGEIAATGQGSAPWDYVWANSVGTIIATHNNVNGTDSIGSLAAGNYSLTVTDNLGCSVALSITVNGVATATAVAANSGPFCVGQTISLTSSNGGTGYSWNGPGGYTSTAQNPTLGGATIAMAGNYSVTVTYGPGCTATDVTNVVVNAGPVPAILPAVVSICNGASATLTASGGNTYAWSTLASTAAITVSPVLTTSYTVTVTDANFCTASVARSVTVNALPTAIINPAVVAICNGASATLTASGGTNYLWSNASSTAAISVSPIITTTYTVTVTDANTCTATASRIVTVNPLPTAIINPAVVAICNGNSAALTASGGTSYLWNNAAISAAITVSPNLTTIYTVTVTDANTCTATASRTVTVNPLPIAMINPTIVAICNGASTTLTASGGTSYLWSDASITAAITVSPITTTTYDVTVTDANTCTGTTSRTVTVNPLPIPIINPAAISICNGASVTLTAGGGTNYLWSNAAITTTISVSPIITTTYDVTVTDANLCTATTSSTVTVNQLPIAIINPAVSTICNGASATITASGGTNYLWSDASITAAITVSPAITSSYSVTVTDANTCTATASRTVTVIPTMNLSTAITDVACNGGSTGAIDLTVSSGLSPYTFLWNDAALTEDRNNIAAANYSVTVTDNAGCTATSSTTVSEPTVLNFTETHTNVLCNGGSSGSIDVTANGGTLPYTYLWNDAVISEDRNNIPTGNYSVTVSDNHLCSASLAVNISEPTAFAIAETHVDVPCGLVNAGSIDITLGGATLPYTYLWNDAVITEDRTTIPVGNYSVTATDNNACSISISVTIASLAGLVISETHTDALCNAGNSGTIDVTLTGNAPPFTYLWNDAIATEDRTNLLAGVYSVTATDANTCLITLSVTINEPSALAITEMHTNALCNGGSSGTIDITTSAATAPYTYLWNDAITTEDRTSITAGNYSVTVRDLNLCSASIAVNISEPTALTVTETHTDALCNGASSGSIDITASAATPPYTYLWNDAITTEDRTTITAGNYSVVVNDFNSCSASISISVSQPTSVIATETHTNALCNGAGDGSINITSSGGTPAYTYLWNDAITTEDRTNIPAGNYSVVVNDLNTCTATLSIVISEPPVLTAVEMHSNASCLGYTDGVILITVSGGTSPYSYLWDDATIALNRTNLAAGIYTITVTDNHSCTASTTAIITEPAGMALSSSFSNPTCETNNFDGSISLNVTGGSLPYHFDWSNGSVQSNLLNVAPGNYDVTVSDANNCTIGSTFSLAYIYDFTVQATPMATINIGESTTLSYTLSGNAGNYESVWSPPSTLSCANCVSPVSTPNVTTHYQIEVRNDVGCIATDTVTILVIPDYSIFVPNAFTPNNDGNNDVFRLFGNIKTIAYLDIQIFNRIGEKVFESQDHNFGWDGTYKGVLQNPSVFIWQMKLAFLDGHREELRKGSVTLMR